MVDAVNHHNTVVVEDLIADAVGTTPSRVEPGELSLQGTTDTSRVLHQGTEHELDDRRRSPFGKPGELPLGRASHPKLVR